LRGQGGDGLILFINGLILFINGLILFINGLILFINDPPSSERHQTLETQGFDALGTIFAYFFRVYILLEIVN